MEKAKRAQLLRERFTAKAGKWQYVGSGHVCPKGEAVTGRIASQSFGLALAHRWGRTEWLETPDEKPKPGLGKRNKQGTPVLIAIAAKAELKKLKRRHAIAEGLLFERKRQSRP